MPPRIVLLFLAVLLIPTFASAGTACCEFCPDQYQQEGQFPYFEVIRTRRLIPDTNLVTAEGWKRVFESCAQTQRVNVTASAEVTVVARAFLQLTDLSTPGVGIEYRWLLDDVPVGATFRFTAGYAGFPHGDDINIVLPHVAAGRHRIAIEARLVGEGRVDLRLLFITAQGFPAARFPGDSLIDKQNRTIGSDWTTAGPVLDLPMPETARLYFQGYIEGSAGDAFDFRYVVDDVPQTPFHIVIPPGGGIALWDHLGDMIAAGVHAVRLEARTATTAVLTLAQVEAATAPVMLQNKALPFLDTANSGSMGTEHQPLNCLIVAAGATGGTGGLGGTPACGQYDLLLDATLPAAPIDDTFRTPLDDYTLFGDGYVDIDNHSDTNGIVTLAVEAIYEDGRVGNCNALMETPDAACPNANTCATADFTLVEYAVPPGRSQKFFFVDPIHWGSAAPNRIRIWARSGNCFGAPAVDLSFARSHLGMQLVPAGAGACFSARDYGRAPAPAVTASITGSQVSVQWLSDPPFSVGYTDILRAEGNGPLAFLYRFPNTTGGYLDNAVRPGVTYRYQLHVVKNSTDTQLPYPFVCGVPSADVRITVPPIAPRRRAVH